MALRETLVYDSDNIGPLTNFGLLFPVVCFISVSGQALSELSYIHSLFKMPKITNIYIS